MNVPMGRMKSCAPIFLWLLLLPSIAAGHARFESASPAPDSVLAEAPSNIVLHFNQPVQPVSVKLINASGVDVASGDVAKSIDNSVILELPSALPPDNYIVSYRVLSGDAHPIAASFSFSIGNTVSAPHESELTTDPGLATTSWGQQVIVSRALFMLGLLLSAGSAWFLILVPAAAPLRPAMQRSVIVSSALTALAALAYLQISGAEMVGSAQLLNLNALEVAIRSSLGASVGLALLGLLILVGGRAKSNAILITGAALLALSRVFTGHPASREPGWLLIPAMALHISCAAYWYGSLRPLYLSLSKLPPAQSADVLRQFSRSAIVAVIALLVAGLLMAIVHLASPSAVLGTWYGQLLVMKTTWFSVLLAIAAWHKLKLSPRVEKGDVRAIKTLRISIMVEAVIMTLVILISVNLASTAPEDPPRSETVTAR
jgi:copper transport protein